MIVVKIGGGCLSDEETIARILDLAATRCRGQLIVVSALKGVTDHLIRAMRRAVEDENSVAETLGALRRRHMAVAERLMAKDCRSLAAFGELLGASLKKLERLLYGLSFTRETTPRLSDRVSSYGERLSAELLTYTLACRGTPAHCLLPEEIGLVTDGKYGDATADLAATARNFAERARGPIESGGVCIMPGFYGVSAAGEVTTFGRGGSDYSAAVAASALEAERLEVWKDTAGFMSADPRVVPGARLIPLLSFDEAAELSYFGAKILHPRTVEPLRRKKIPIAVKNTLDPDAPGSRIELKGVRTDSGVKSVAHAGDLGLLKIHGSGVGARPGILARVSGALSGMGLNIKSAVTSQTCISLLLAEKDLEAGRRTLAALSPKPFRRLEAVGGLALVGLVGEGLAAKTGVAARAFSALAKAGVNIEAISFGPSPVALYCLVPREGLETALAAVHEEFFGSS